MAQVNFGGRPDRQPSECREKVHQQVRGTKSSGRRSTFSSPSAFGRSTARMFEARLARGEQNGSPHPGSARRRDGGGRQIDSGSNSALLRPTSSRRRWRRSGLRRTRVGRERAWSGVHVLLLHSQRPSRRGAPLPRRSLTSARSAESALPRITRSFGLSWGEHCLLPVWVCLRACSGRTSHRSLDRDSSGAVFRRRTMVLP